jgi:hypothetical protein
MATIYRIEAPGLTVANCMYPGRPRPKGFRPLRGDRFANALRRANEEGWRYVEGWINNTYIGDISEHHAWCLDEGGVLVEVTYRSVGRDYRGVVIPIEEVTARLTEPGLRMLKEITTDEERTLVRWDAP